MSSEDAVITALLLESERTGVHPRDILKQLPKRLRPHCPPRWNDGTNAHYHDATILRSRDGQLELSTSWERNDWFRQQVDELGRHPEVVAAQFGVSRATVLNHCGRRSVRTERYEHWRQAVEACLRTRPELNNRQIADGIGCSPAYVQRRRKHREERQLLEHIASVCPIQVRVRDANDYNRRGLTYFAVVQVLEEERRDRIRLLRWRAYEAEDGFRRGRRFPLPEYTGVLRRWACHADGTPVMHLTDIREAA